MRSRKTKPSRRQRLNLLRCFFLLRDRVFNGRLGLDGNPQIAGVSLVPGAVDEFAFILQKEGDSGSVCVKTKLAADGGSITTTSSIRLEDGAVVDGELQEMLARPDKTPILPQIDSDDLGRILVQAMTTREGAAISEQYPLDDEAYADALQHGKRMWSASPELMGHIEYEELMLRHKRIRESYVYVPSDDGGPRDLTEDEQLLLDMLFALRAIAEEIENGNDYALATGWIMFDEEAGLPVVQSMYVDVKHKKSYIGFQVNGPLHTAGPENLAFFRAMDEGEENIDGLVYLPTMAEAVTEVETIHP